MFSESLILPKLSRWYQYAYHNFAKYLFTMSIYWKIFISFWCASILIIVTTAWVTSEITRQSSIPVHEKVLMDSYANAAVATFESGRYVALKKWLDHVGSSRHMVLYLLCSTGEIISKDSPPPLIRKIEANLIKGHLKDGLLRFGDVIVSHEIVSKSGYVYRLVAMNPTPYFAQVPWAGLIIRLSIAIGVSGLMCYLLSMYLTQPLRSLMLAVRSIAGGHLDTRVGELKGHHHDEIATLIHEFNRMVDKLERMMLSKERLLQDISHELRSPLARLQIAIELGRKQCHELADQEFSRMLLECTRLNTLIEEILEYTRLDLSVRKLQSTSVNIAHLLEEIIYDANFEFSSENTYAVLKKGDYLWDNYPLLIDEQLIYRALENILRNALRYSPKNEVVLVSIVLDKDNKQVMITIEDHGPGVPPDQLEKIFNPFYRVDTSRDKGTGGYGLGLSIAQQAIYLHQGSIKATNRKTGGLQVSVVLGLPSSE